MCMFIYFFTDSPPEERMSSFSHVRSADDDAIFKERLRNMGKSEYFHYKRHA